MFIIHSVGFEKSRENRIKQFKMKTWVYAPSIYILNHVCLAMPQNIQSVCLDDRCIGRYQTQRILIWQNLNSSAFLPLHMFMLQFQLALVVFFSSMHHIFYSALFIIVNYCSCAGCTNSNLSGHCVFNLSTRK